LILYYLLAEERLWRFGQVKKIYITRKALVLKGNRQMGQPRRRFNQVQKANKGEDTVIKKRERKEISTFVHPSVQI
jgi:hypothetical protein